MSGLRRNVHRLQRRLGRRAGKGAVEIVVEPQPVGWVQLAAPHFFSCGEASERAGDRERVEQHPGRIGRDAEPGSARREAIVSAKQEPSERIGVRWPMGGSKGRMRISVRNFMR